MSAKREIISKDRSVTIVESRHIGERERQREEILAGLTAADKHIPSKFFYDAAGSALFEEITRLREYYLTRTERSILTSIAPDIGGKLDNVDIVELGSGDCSKISILLRAVPARSMASIRYIPVDVSRIVIEESAARLTASFPGIAVEGVIGDFTRHLDLAPTGVRRLFCFFGSTIGNLARDEAVRFLRGLSRIMRPGDELLLGADMVKDRGVLEEAYNDNKGVTAAFNRNILNVVNDIAETDFDPDEFEHLAFYNDELFRIEMHLEALRDVAICCPHVDCGIALERGETIHTENSHKFTMEMIEGLASASRLRIEKTFTDDDGWFSVVRLRKPGETLV